MKGFKLPRKPKADFAEKLIQENAELGVVLAEKLQGALPAIALDGHPALSTAYMNDCEPLLCFAQQVNLQLSPYNITQLHCIIHTLPVECCYMQVG
mgnify:CR=1 FL=1